MHNEQEQGQMQTGQIVGEQTDQLVDIQTGRQKFHPNLVEARIMLVAGGAVAALYALCFAGVQIRPQLSFSVFCPSVLLIWSAVLQATGRFKNKRAFIWAVPILICAAFNGIFHANPFTWGNALLTHGLFAAFTLTALREESTDVFQLSGLLALVRMVMGNWIAFIDVIRVAFTERLSAGHTANSHITHKSQRVKKILLGFILALPFMIIITALLMSADAMFGKLASDLFTALFGADWLSMPFVITFVIVWIYAMGYPYLAITRSRDIRSFNIPLPRADITVCATFLLSVNAVFALFTFIQFAFLFNGGFMQLPADMVYSQYAREGFFQLLFVTVINFAVIIVFMTMLTGVINNKLLRGLLGALCFFTGVLIVSSFYRMGLYTGAYGHTTLRLCVYTFLVMEVALLGVTAWKLFDARVAFIRLYVMVGLVFYLIANVTGSDYIAAKLNASMFRSGQLTQIDLYPVGPDGLRALQPLIEDEANVCVGYALTSKEHAKNFAKYESEWEQDYNSLTARVFNTSADTVPWQNWSYLKRNTPAK